MIDNKHAEKRRGWFAGVPHMMPWQAKRRRYPIKRDEQGRSARQRAFALFDQGCTPAGVAAQVEISARTARRYHADWKKRPENYDIRYVLMKMALLDQHVRSRVAQAVASELKLPVRAVLPYLSRPWAAKQLLTGEWRNWAAEERERRERLRVKAATDIIEMHERESVPLEMICATLGDLRARVTQEWDHSSDAPPWPPGHLLDMSRGHAPTSHVQSAPPLEAG